MKKNNFLSTVYTIEASKTFIFSVLIGLGIMLSSALVKYFLDFKAYAYIDFIITCTLLLVIAISFMLSKSRLYHLSKYYWFIFMLFNIGMVFVYMLGFVDDFLSVIVGLSYVLNIVAVILSMIGFGKKYGCLDELLGKK